MMLGLTKISEFLLVVTGWFRAFECEWSPCQFCIRGRNVIFVEALFEYTFVSCGSGLLWPKIIDAFEAEITNTLNAVLFLYNM